MTRGLAGRVRRVRRLEETRAEAEQLAREIFALLDDMDEQEVAEVGRAIESGEWEPL